MILFNCQGKCENYGRNPILQALAPVPVSVLVTKLGTGSG